MVRVLSKSSVGKRLVSLSSFCAAPDLPMCGRATHQVRVGVQIACDPDIALVREDPLCRR
jgi:hypothetical protein